MNFTQIELTIEQLINFLKKPFWSTVFAAYEDCKAVLEKVLKEKVFNYATGNKNIRDFGELVSLVSSAKNSARHKPGAARDGKPYASSTLQKKESMGEHRPHKFENYGFWSGIEEDIIGFSLKLYVRELETNNKGYDYLLAHEKERSVLKTTFLLAWQELIETIVKRYATEMMNS